MCTLRTHSLCCVYVFDMGTFYQVEELNANHLRQLVVKLEKVMERSPILLCRPSKIVGIFSF